MTAVRKALVWTFIASWTWAGVYYLAGGRLTSPTFPAFSLVYMWIPGLVALLLARQEGVRLRVWARPNRYWLLAWGLPIALSLLAVLPSLAFAPYVGLEAIRSLLPPEAAQVPDVFLWVALLVQSLLAGATVNLVFALGEELMWRGYLWERLKPLGFWRAALVIGVAWGLWHAPLILQGFNYPQHPGLGVVWMVAFTTLLTPWMLYLRERGGAILVAALFHGTLNASAGLSLVVVARTNDLTVGLLGLAGFFVLLAANLALRGLRPAEG